MLATDVPLGITGSTFQTDSSFNPANTNVDIGPTHIVEVLNGRYNAIDRNTGVRVQSETLNGFLENAGATLFSDPINPRIVYDQLSERWFVSANGQGTANWIYIAFSDGSNPTGNWQSLQFVGDSTGLRYNDKLTMSVDADAVYFATNNIGLDDEIDVSLYSIPKADMFLPDATLTNMSRFENMDPLIYGNTIQVAMNFEASDGKAIALSAATPSSVKYFEILGADSPGATLTDPIDVCIEADCDAPVYVGAVPAETLEDPTQLPIVAYFVETSDELTGGIVEVAGGVWGSKTVSDGTTNYAAWFELDAVDGAKIQAGTIQTGNHVYYPSISVNEYGIAALSYNQSGIGMAISAFTTVGITVHGLQPRDTQMEDPFEMQPGLEYYNISNEDDGFISEWGYTSVRHDPADLHEFASTAAWANTVDRWSTHVAHISPWDMEPIVPADENDNVITLRRNAVDTELIEIEMDGVVTDLLPYEVLGRVVIRAGAGSDRIIIDYVNGDPTPERGFLIDGEGGFDVIVVENAEDNFFHVTDNGIGMINEITDFTNTEQLVGGHANDLFVVDDNFDDDNPAIGFLAGFLIGREGDDYFQFNGQGSIGDSVNGDEGYNTISFLGRDEPTILTMVAESAFQGFNGKTGVNGPIGTVAQLEDQFRDISNIIGSETERDVLHGFDIQGTWTIDDANSNYLVNGRTLDFQLLDTLNASSFDDTFNVLSNSLERLTLNGLDGNDAYNFSSDAPNNMGTTENINGLIFAMGGAGENTLSASNLGGSALDVLVLAKRIFGMGEIVFDAQFDGGTFDVYLQGSPDADVFALHSFLTENTMVVETMGGNDSFDIQDLSKADVDLFGGDGDDLYVIEMVQGVNFRNLRVHDSVGSERDRVSLRGTILNETFLLTTTTFDDLEVTYTGIEEFGALGRGGNDTFYVTDFVGPLFLEGNEGNDIFYISSDAPNNQGDLLGFTGPITVDGGTGQNQMMISNYGGSATNALITDSTITGLLPTLLTYTSTGGSFQIPGGGIGGISIRGSNANPNYFDVQSLLPTDSLMIETYAGKDIFDVRKGALGNVKLVGGDNFDRYRMVASTNGLRQGEIIETVGTDDKNRISYFANNDNNAIGMTSNSISVASETTMVSGEIAFVEVVGLDGHDTFTVTGSPAKTTFLLGQEGNDRFDINGTVGTNGMRLVGNDGEDQFNINGAEITTYIRAIGGSEDDSFQVGTAALGTVSTDGNEGSDTYNVDIVGSGSRFVGALDSGAVGTDTVNVFGTDGADDMEFRAANIYGMTERVAFGGTAEVVSMNGSGGNDTLHMFSSFADQSIIRGDADNDGVIVHSTTHAVDLNIQGGSGADTILVEKTHVVTLSTVVDGGTGGDLLSIGSTIGDNNGNLGKIRGPVTFLGNQGEDHLFVSDHGVNGGYSYEITEDHITTHPGRFNVPRDIFAGIYFDASLESARLNGTPLPNSFIVSASQSTEFMLDGESPTPDNAFGDEIVLTQAFSDGRDLVITSEPEGAGFWTFGNGNERVSFTNMETIVDEGSGSPIIAHTGDDDDDGPATPPQFMRFDPATPIDSLFASEESHFECGIAPPGSEALQTAGTDASDSFEVTADSFVDDVFAAIDWS